MAIKISELWVEGDELQISYSPLDNSIVFSVFKDGRFMMRVDENIRCDLKAGQQITLSGIKIAIPCKAM